MAAQASTLQDNSHLEDDGPSEPLELTRPRPGDPRWPDAAAWAALNARVGGALVKVRPLFDPEGAGRQGDGADDPATGIFNPFWIGDQAGGTETSGYLDGWSPAPSAYAIKARHAGDVAAGVDFAREHGLRLVVKGTGHSYLGNSNAPDSLLIWTRAMRDVAVHDAFTGQGCEADPVPAVSAGAGAMWVDLYDAVTNKGGRYVQGGGCMSVGVAGLVQGGGFGVFSKRYGTAAAALLEAEVVTADGRIRTVNASRDPELFWALKGGGGGSFGVVTRLTLQTFDLPDHLGDATGEVEARSEAAFARLVARFVAFYASDLCNPHWGDHVHSGPGLRFEVAMVCQGLDPGQAAAAWRPFFDWVQAHPDDYTVTAPLRTGAVPAREWWDVAKSPLLRPDPRDGAPSHHGWSRCDQDEVGVYLHGYDSVWLPGSLLSLDGQEELVAGVLAASRHQMVRFQFAKGLTGAPEAAREAARDTATHPAMIDAFTLAVVADGEAPAYPGMDRPPVDLDTARANARAIARAMAELRRMAPEGGSYVSESSYHTEDWATAFWGANYPRLLQAKQDYDPDGLFFARHGVGSEDWSDDGFTRRSAAAPGAPPAAATRTAANSSR